MIEYAKSSRFPFRRWLVAAALGSVALTAHANLSLVNYKGFEVRQSGNTWTFSHEPPSSTVLRGGTVLPNAAVSSSQRALVASKTLPYGKGLPVDVVAKIPAGNLARALVGAGKVLTPIGAAVTAVELLNYFKDAGLLNVRNTPDGLMADGKSSGSGSQPSDGYEYMYEVPGNSSMNSGWHGSRDAACEAYTGAFYSARAGFKYEPFVNSGGACVPKAYYKDTGNRASTYDGTSTSARRTSSCPIGSYCGTEPQTKPMSEQEIIDKIALDSGWPTSAAIAAQKAISLGIPIQTDTPTVSGPGNILGEKTTSSEPIKLNPGTNTPSAPGATNTDPGTKTTTKTQSHKAEYSGNSVKTSTTTNTVTNITNNITNVTTTEISNEIKEDEEKPDICEKNPDALMCQKIDLDTPEGKIPKTEKRVDFSSDDSFGGGYCPSNKYQTIKGQSLLIVNWSQNCDAITTWVKPIVIALSIFMAFMIVSGASRE